MSPPAAARRVLVVGGSGLVGRALVAQLLADPRCAAVHLLLRQASAEPPADPRLVVHRVDFEALHAAPRSLELPPLDDAYCAVGTTIKVAGSQAAFRKVDFDVVVDSARAAQHAGARRLAVVSALGASRRSRVFYNRVKGEMEEALARLGFDTLAIARPSLLAGDRRATGQPPRRGERIALALLAPLAPLLPARIRPIEAARVARALRAALASGVHGVHVLESAELQRLGA